MPRVVDPPSGWLYGFPCEDDWDPESGETREEWFLRKGYPQKLIDQGMLQYCRSWYAEDES